MKQMEEDNFDDAKVNLFDIKTAEAMTQISNISNENIMKQLNLDAGDYADMVKEQREMILLKIKK